MKKALAWVAMLACLSLAYGCGSSSGETTFAVSSYTPAFSATDVALSSVLTATFNKDANPATVNTATFTLVSAEVTGRPTAQAEVSGTVSYNAVAKTATFTPSAALLPSTRYTATLAIGIQDTTGQGLPAAVSWSFTTAASPPVTTLNIIAVIGAVGGYVRVQENNGSGAYITDATATVNGYNFPFRADRANQYWSHEEGFTCAAGSPVQVVVAWRGLTVTSSAIVMPYTPTITQPASGASLSRASAITVNWSDPPAGQEAEYFHINATAGSSHHYGAHLGPAVRTYDIPADSLNAGPAEIMVRACRLTVDFTGSAGSDSSVGAEGDPTVSVTLTE